MQPVSSSYLPILLYALSAVALALLGFCVYRLVTVFTGWKCTCEAANPQMSVDIPKAGRYSLCVSRVRFAIFSGIGAFFDAFTKADFSITRSVWNESIPFHRSWGVQSRSFGRITIPVGYFDAPEAGGYLVNNLSADNFSQGDSVIVRKYLSIPRFVLLILGIVFSGMIFLAGIIIASLMIGGVM